MRGYHLHSSPRSDLARGPHPSRFEGWDSSSHAERAQAVLRTEALALPHVQVFSAASLSRNSARGTSSSRHWAKCESATAFCWPVTWSCLSTCIPHSGIGEPQKGTPSTVLQVIKQRGSREMRAGQATEGKEKAPPFQLRRVGHPATQSAQLSGR